MKLIQIGAKRPLVENHRLELRSMPSWAVVGSLDVLSGMQHAHDFEATSMHTVEDHVILESANRPDPDVFERGVFGFPATGQTRVSGELSHRLLGGIQEPECESGALSL
jgi:hypothetical protein